MASGAHYGIQWCLHGTNPKIAVMSFTSREATVGGLKIKGENDQNRSWNLLGYRYPPEVQKVLQDPAGFGRQAASGEDGSRQDSIG